MADLAAPAYAILAASLVKIRAQINTLHAAEAALLVMGDELAALVAARDGHTDHGEFEHRAVAAEFAAAVHESDRTMAGRISRARTLVEHYPTVMAALTAGRISHAHAAVITDAGSTLTDPQSRAGYAAAVLEVAETNTVGRLRPVAREFAERFADRTLDDRHQDARACRMVRVTELDDGMADLTATLPAVYASGIKDRLNQMARLVKQNEQAWADDQAHNVSGLGTEPGSGAPSGESEGESAATAPTVRSMDQIRADLFTDMLLASDPNHAATSGLTGITGIQARIQVIVPKERVTGEDEPSPPGTKSGGHRATGTPPATLAGYGPIDTDTARHLAGHATHWEEVTVDPDTGTVLSVDTYRPNTKLRQFLRARDLHCRFPGCHTPTAHCDIDHTIDAAHGGPTTSTNLAHLCRRHHTLKHHSRWTVTQTRHGTLTWTSPAGTHYPERAPSTVRFRRTTEQPPGPPCSEPPGEQQPERPGQQRPKPPGSRQPDQPAP
ncbi:HNH endonuclease [Leucobacter rhizosphaerae]|uniref:HNH endonuclease n=1 Tax=Leucobacter rhizosphaerae TaxID=2932245 RepID=A0ABY4FY15_9MICO|nr:HNH endonuclease signature motif containing protein [Leucobacter rhizosphaerae]UOQ61197.1 HNH endonuclease [Leucobacter rhizosphaerae]